MSYFDITGGLVMNLVRPHIEARPKNGLITSLLSKTSFILGQEVLPEQRPEPTPAGNGDLLPRFADTRKRCDVCLFEISGVD